MRSPEYHQRGDVVYGPALFKQGSQGRPWLILSGESHPFQGEEYIAVALTTTEREAAYRLSEEEWVRGGSPGDSFVSPWTTITLKHTDITGVHGELCQSAVNAVARHLAVHIGLEL